MPFQRQVDYPWSTLESRLDATHLQLVESAIDEHKKKHISPLKSYSALDWAGVFLPCVNWLRTYSVKRQLWRDCLAGLSVAALVVPQGMSYAGLAGLPPVYGLYGAFVPVIIYSLLGSSRQLAVGPVAVTSFILGSALPEVVPGYIVGGKNTPEIQRAYEHAAIHVAFLAGVLYTAVGVFQLGFIINFISHSVVSGFCSGAAVLIGMSQIKFFLVTGNVKVKQTQENTLVQQIQFLDEALSSPVPPPKKGSTVQYPPGPFNWRELVMGLSFLTVLLLFKYLSRAAGRGKLGPRLKWLSWLRCVGPIFVCVVGILAVVIGDLDGASMMLIKTIQNIPAGLPTESATWLASIDNLGPKFRLALLVMAIDVLESTSIAKTVARKNNYRINNTQEVVGLGVANVIGSLFHSYTTTGSFSRSALNNEVGATSQMSSFVQGWIVAFVLLFLTPVFERLPYNATAAIIIAAVMGIFDGDQAWWYFKIKAWRDLLVWLAAFFGVVFAGVELGLAIGIGLSLLLVLLDSAFPQLSLLGRIPGTKVFKSEQDYHEAEEVAGVLVFQVEGPLFFGNILNVVASLKSKIQAREVEDRFVHYVVFDLSTVPYIDGTATHEMMDLAGDLKINGRQLILSGPNISLMARLTRAGLVDELGKEWVFVDTSDAVQHAVESIPTAKAGLLDGDVELAVQPVVAVSQQR